MKQIISPCIFMTFLIATIQFPGTSKSNESVKNNPFSKKIVGFSMLRDFNKVGAMYVTDAEIKKLGDRYFLRGKLADIKAYDDSKGKIIWVALSEIFQIIEHDSLAEVEALYKKNN